jgi:hypothetical protein
MRLNINFWRQGLASRLMVRHDSKPVFGRYTGEEQVTKPGMVGLVGWNVHVCCCEWLVLFAVLRGAGSRLVGAKL